MIRYLILLLFFKGILFGCTLCSVYSPKTNFDISLKANKDEILNAKIKWVFAPEFTTELLQLYDTNLDTKFDKDELTIIKDSLLAYIEPRNYLTFISYDTKINEESKKITIKKDNLYFKDGILTFEYEFDLNYPIIDKHRLYVEVYDEEGYFIMISNQEKQFLRIPYKIKKEMDYNSTTFIIDAPQLANAIETTQSDTSKKIQSERRKNLVEKSIQIEEEKNTPKEETLLESFVKKVKKYLVEIERGEDKFALVFLLLVSFAYGILHALGPGHGKALAFSYFSAQKSTYLQAFGISLATAFIHIVGALILVVISVFILQSVLNSFLDDSIKYITQTSAVLIMLLSLFILYRKLMKKVCVCSACNTSDKPLFTTNNSGVNFVKTTTNTIHFDNSRKKQDLFFVLTAGLVPCPGTVVLFVYAFILKTYFSVILASIAISLGMGLVIFASSFLGVSLNKVSAKSQKIINIVEILAPIIMFILGLMLLLNADIL